MTDADVDWVALKKARRVHFVITRGYHDRGTVLCHPADDAERPKMTTDLLENVTCGRCLHLIYRALRGTLYPAYEPYIAALPPSARERELEKALQPFALAADDIDDDDEDHYHIWEAPVAMNITVGELRNARAVLAKEKAGG